MKQNAVINDLLVIGGRFLEKLDIETIYEMYFKDIYQFALFYTNNRHEAEDITQETFVKVMKNLPTLRDSARIKTWIFSIVKFTAIDFKRKQKFVQFFPDWMIEKESGERSPEMQVIHKGDWQELQLTLLKLKPQYRTVVILRDLKDFSIKETAEIMGCSERKVRVDYHRAIQQMKRSIQMNEKGWGAKSE